MRFYLLILALYLCSVLHGQDVHYARKLVRVLSSEGFHGRGYVSDGDKKAALFIKREMQLHRLVPVASDGYFQNFELAANTFPKKPLLLTDVKRLTPGTDYIVGPASCSCKGTYPVLRFDSTVYRDSAAFVRFFRADHSNEVVLLDPMAESEKHVQEILKGLAASNSFGAKAIIELNDGQPIFAPSTFVREFCSFRLARDKWPTDATVVTYELQSEFVEKYETANVLGQLPGATDTAIVITAHYDHIGRLGPKVHFPGANDNASGVAMLLDLARHYAVLTPQQRHYRYVFMAFSGEESGLVGSQFYVNNPLFELSKIKQLINLDMVGSAEEGVTVVNATLFPESFERIRLLNEQLALLPSVQARGKASNSDHHHFTEKGVKAFYFYGRGTHKHYHSVYDTAQELKLGGYEGFFRLITNYLDTLH